jgi:hypothetical protein
MTNLEKVIKGLECLSNPYAQDMDDRDCENCQYDNACCFLDVTADALSLLKAQEVPDNGGWISVKKRLPEIGEPFYAACKSLIDERENWIIEGIYRMNIIGGPWGVIMVECGKAEVYAWMPKILPEPPKKERSGRRTPNED